MDEEFWGYFEQFVEEDPYGPYGVCASNSGLAHVPVGEPDAFVCECVYYETTNRHNQVRQGTCGWFSQLSYDLSILTVKGRTIPENFVTATRARAHRRLAMTLQAAGYKGSTHPKALERASKERDQLL